MPTLRARPPSIGVEPRHLVVRTALVAGDGSELAPLEVTLPRTFADLLDPTATPSGPVLAALAAARGEDLVIEGPVASASVEGVTRLAETFGQWWGTGPIRVEAENTFEPSTPAPPGVGLFFSSGVDSWSTLLDLLEAEPPDRVTHLITVHHGNELYRPSEVGVVDRNQRAADELGLDLLVMSTTARRLLDPFRPWIAVVLPALYSTGLVAGGGLGRFVLSSTGPATARPVDDDDPSALDDLMAAVTPLVIANGDRWRHERVAHLLGSALARRNLQICWEGMGAGNCGRCLKCQLTMAALVLAGDPDPAAGFDTGPDPAVVRTLDLKPYQKPMVEPLIAGLPPEREELRRAWADAWETTQGLEPTARWGEGAAHPTTGPGVPQRVATALRARTGSADTQRSRPLGWRVGSVPLRPRLDQHDAIRALAASDSQRPVPWAVVEPHSRDGQRDGTQLDLALACTEAHGPGLCYIPGILWAPDQPPVLGPDAVARMLRRTRVRLWRREDGDLDALRVLEAIENGCLPVQVMPPAAARDLTRSLPAALTPTVRADDALPGLDLSPSGVAATLASVVDHVLAGSPERDLLIGSTGG